MPLKNQEKNKYLRSLYVQYGFVYDHKCSEHATKLVSLDPQLVVQLLYYYGPSARQKLCHSS